MKNFVKLWLNSHKWIHIYEIMVEFINLELIWINNDPSVAVISLPALRLLHFCWSGPLLFVTGVEICLAFLSAMNKTLETFKLRDYHEINLMDTVQTEQLDLQKAFKQVNTDDRYAMDNSRRRQNNLVMTWRFTGEDSAEECFPPCCWLLHYELDWNAACL